MSSRRTSGVVQRVTYFESLSVLALLIGYFVSGLSLFLWLAALLTLFIAMLTAALLRARPPAHVGTDLSNRRLATLFGSVVILFTAVMLFSRGRFGYGLVTVAFSVAHLAAWEGGLLRRRRS